MSVDDVPVNMVSHAHGQGYADLHFLIPELVDRVDVLKGPYDVRDGDFATAGAVAFRTVDRVRSPAMSLRTGSFGARQLLGYAPLHRLPRSASLPARSHNRMGHSSSRRTTGEPMAS